MATGKLSDRHLVQDAESPGWRFLPHQCEMVDGHGALADFDRKAPLQQVEDLRLSAGLDRPGQRHVKTELVEYVGIAEPIEVRDLPFRQRGTQSACSLLRGQ